MKVHNVFKTKRASYSNAFGTRGSRLYQRDSIEEERLKVLVPREQLAAPIFSALLATWVDTPLSKLTPEDLVRQSYRFVDLLLKHSNNNTNNNNNKNQ